MGRPVVHFEIGCRDSKQTQEFYAKMFDWKIEPLGPAGMIAPVTPGIGGHITALGHEPHTGLTGLGTPSSGLTPLLDQQSGRSCAPST